MPFALITNIVSKPKVALESNVGLGLVSMRQTKQLIHHQRVLNQLMNHGKKCIHRLHLGRHQRGTHLPVHHRSRDCCRQHQSAHLAQSALIAFQRPTACQPRLPRVVPSRVQCASARVAGGWDTTHVATAYVVVFRMRRERQSLSAGSVIGRAVPITS